MVSGVDLVKIQVYDGGNLAGADPVQVAVNDGGFSPATENTNYDCGTGCSVWEYSLDTTGLANDSHRITVQVSDDQSPANVARVSQVVRKAIAHEPLRAVRGVTKVAFTPPRTWLTRRNAPAELAKVYSQKFAQRDRQELAERAEHVAGMKASTCNWCMVQWPTAKRVHRDLLQAWGQWTAPAWRLWAARSTARA